MRLAALGLAVISICGATWGCARPGDPGADGGVTGCSGVCSSDGGGGTTDGGTIGAPDAGTDAGVALCEGVALGSDAGVVTVEELRALPACGQQVRVVGVRVVALDRMLPGTNIHVGATAVDFWIASPDAGAGFYVRKAYEDLPRALALDAGDVVTVDGFLTHVPAIVTGAGSADNGLNHRPYLGSLPLGGDAGVLRVSSAVAGPPVEPREVDAGEFGDAQGGAVAPDPELAGLPVHVQGPVEVTAWEPPALAVETPSGPAFRGFEISGGILVVDDRVHPGCGLRAQAVDGGALQLPEGVTGIWDTYSHGPCLGLDVYGNFCGVTDAGTVPGAPGRPFTYALYLQACAAVDAGS